jgi:hypothetical protein
MNKFQQGKIYTIRSHQSDDIYIGSTIDGLSRRLCGHRAKYKRYLIDKKSNLASFEILKYPDYYIELLESFPCDNKNELHRREGELIRSMDCVNKIIAGRTPLEYRQDNKEHQKEYNQLNKLKIAEYRQEYNQLNKIKFSEYYQLNKIQIAENGKEYRQINKLKIADHKKEYNQLNKIKIAKHKKEYRQLNKIKIQERKTKKCICVCGGKYTQQHKSHHENTLRHIVNFIAC